MIRAHLWNTNTYYIILIKASHLNITDADLTYSRLRETGI